MRYIHLQTGVLVESDRELDSTFYAPADDKPAEEPVPAKPAPKKRTKKE